MRDLYSLYIFENNIGGSNKASSYIRALDLLSTIMSRKAVGKFGLVEVWSISSIQQVTELYDFIIEQQKVGDDAGVFKGESPPSYWRNRYYSAALKSYKHFLITYNYEKTLWKFTNDPGVTASELSKHLVEQKGESLETLVNDKFVGFTSKEGKEKIRKVKTRLNQGFFRKMILSTYRTQCCVTGLNFPDVLRASHIVAWSDNVAHRMNPANGLCLSATYDAAFDRHLISFDEDYRMILSPTLSEYCSNDAFRAQFKEFEGRKINLPRRFPPNHEFLGSHREQMVL